MYKVVIDQADLSQKDDDLFEKLISVRRTTKVSKGGRVFGFSVLSIVGNKSGNLGIGIGKSREVSSAIQKSMANARKKMKHFKFDNETVHHITKQKYCSTKIVILPASKGTGIISSQIIRSVFEALGIKNVLTKCYGSKNHTNMIKCTIKCLSKIIDSVKTNSIRIKLKK